MLWTKEAANLVGRLDTEAEYAVRLWDLAWNGGFERTHDQDEQREYLQTAALALNALGNIRLAQAIQRQQNNSR
jgi:hypothetical protein